MATKSQAERKRQNAIYEFDAAQCKVYLTQDAADEADAALRKARNDLSYATQVLVNACYNAAPE